MSIIALKSMTYSIKLYNALKENYIESEIVKLEPNMTKRGCAYGVKINSVNLEHALKVIQNKSIKYSEIIKAYDIS